MTSSSRASPSWRAPGRRGVVPRPAFDGEEAQRAGHGCRAAPRRDRGAANRGKTLQLRQQHGGEAPPMQASSTCRPVRS